MQHARRAACLERSDEPVGEVDLVALADARLVVAGRHHQPAIGERCVAVGCDIDQAIEVVTVPVFGPQVLAIRSASRIELALHGVEQVAEVEDVGAALGCLAQVPLFHRAIGVRAVVVCVGPHEEPQLLAAVDLGPDDQDGRIGTLDGDGWHGLGP